MKAIFSRRVAVFLLWLSSAAVCVACTVPVFRYGLDRWPADDYRLECPVGWVATDEGGRIVSLLEEQGSNIEVVESAEVESGGRLISGSGGSGEVWAGELAEQTVLGLATSVAGDEVVENILAGDSVVWVMVESGERERDEAFAEALAGRLDFLESVAEIPPQDPNDPDSQLGPGPELGVGFSMVRVAQDAEGEELFLRALLGAQGDEKLAADLPVAAAVFGRGRVLGVWNSEDLDDEGIDEVSLFLLGACSCQVKSQNPGWDLLMAVDWDEALMGVAMAQEGIGAEGLEPEVAGAESVVEEVAEVELEELEVVEFGAGGSEAVAAGGVGRATWVKLGLLVGSGVFVAGVIGLLIWRRSEG
ncbi:MAG: hypothetical protein P8J87_09385 [Verrucomicrobiales bacterium]|nr:hypothetical protein [Verrucomicrobiales bacterium]